VIEHRRIDEGAVKAFTAANELVAAKADVLVVSGAEIGLQAVAAARPAVPIVVMANNFDPIAQTSRSRPDMSVHWGEAVKVTPRSKWRD